VLQRFLKGNHAAAFPGFGDSIALLKLETPDITPELANGHIHDPFLSCIHGDHKGINIIFYIGSALIFVQVVFGFHQPLFRVMMKKFIHIKVDIVLRDNDPSEIIEHFGCKAFFTEIDLTCTLVQLYVCIPAA
jgi:hypothetical protein